jgi:hypothetical protein
MRNSNDRGIPDEKMNGTRKVTQVLLLLALVCIGLFSGLRIYGASRWERQTGELRSRLEAKRMPPGTTRVDFRDLEGLPAPVQRYFRTVLKDGQPIIAAARVRHQGSFNMDEKRDAWKPFVSDQRVVTRGPGFDWDARVYMLPGLPVHVHDAYIDGQGMLHAAVLGLFTVADMRGTQPMAEGELMRFLAEAAWYPTALLPSQGISWTAVNEHSAHATLTDGNIALTMLFSFNEQGLIDTVSARARGRTVGNQVIPTPWQGRFWNHEKRGGMLVPLSGEVSWLLPEGPRPYWRGKIHALEYEFAS